MKKNIKRIYMFGKRMGAEAEKNGGHGGMDFLMMYRIVYCIRNGEALEQDVYNAAG